MQCAQLHTTNDFSGFDVTSCTNFLRSFDVLEVVGRSGGVTKRRPV